GASCHAPPGMRALAALYGLDVDLKPLAARVGADVSFFLRGGAALIEGVGERVTPVEVERSWFAIAWPGIELSTAAVYEAWDKLDPAEVTGPNQLRGAAGRVDERVDRFAEHLGEGWRMTGSGSAGRQAPRGLGSVRDRRGKLAEGGGRDPAAHRDRPEPVSRPARPLRRAGEDRKDDRSRTREHP